MTCEGGLLLKEALMAYQQPNSLDRIIGQSRAQSGDPPEELRNPRNYLVFDRLPSAGAPKDAASVITKGREGRFTINDPGTVLGIVMEKVKPVTPEFIKSEVAGIKSAEGKPGLDGSSFIPDWTAVSAAPTLAPTIDRPYLVRRNGVRVRPEWVINPATRARPIIRTLTLSRSSAAFLFGLMHQARIGVGGAPPHCWV